jgi:hypothetical protein
VTYTNETRLGLAAFFRTFNSGLAQFGQVVVQVLSQHYVRGAHATAGSADCGQGAVSNYLFDEKWTETGVLRCLLNSETARRKNWRRVRVDGAGALVHPEMISQETARFHSRRLVVF